METRVYIQHNEGAKYPKWDDATCYGPSKLYAEFSSEADNVHLSEENMVYDMVRNAIAAIGLDEKQFGSADWNPFSEFITPGQTVLVKPNMVHHRNGDENYGTDCLVTHPAVVRAVLDYVLLALKGTGRVILADAPVQSCDFSILVRELHYDKLIDYYANRGMKVELMDLRQLDEAYIKSISESARFTAQNEDVVVSMGQDSAFFDKAGIGQNINNLRITNYLPEHMQEYHKVDDHKYSVAKAVISADVIINLPKPKTHRKAGMTASLKNMVGCVAKKECLPHHTRGSKGEMGDEYLKNSIFKKYATKFQEKNDRLIAQGKQASKIYIFMQRVVYKLARMQHVDGYTEGSWYGNDTLWRTICDICRVVLYADKKGNMQQDRQRNMFILADMIVSGEGEGPICPSPKEMGMLVAGWEQIAVDKTIAALMGFPAEKIPSIQNAAYGNVYKLPENEINIMSNDERFNNKAPKEIKERVKPFTPTSGWKEWLGD